MKKINLPFNTPADIYRTHKMMSQIKSSSIYQLYHKYDNGPFYPYTKAGYTPPNQPKKSIFRIIKENIDWKINYNKQQKLKRQQESLPIQTIGYFPPKAKKQPLISRINQSLNELKWKLRGDGMQ